MEPAGQIPELLPGMPRRCGAGLLKLYGYAESTADLESLSAPMVREILAGKRRERHIVVIMGKRADRGLDIRRDPTGYGLRNVIRLRYIGQMERHEGITAGD